MAKDCMLTTFDNPYNPFEEFVPWFLFDVEKGYNTCSHLARVARLTDDMSQKEIDIETERAIDEIIKYDFMNIYKKVTVESADADDQSEFDEIITDYSPDNDDQTT